MIRTARVFGFVLIASVAFGTAAGISAVGTVADAAAVDLGVARSAPEPGPYGFGDRLAAGPDACTVEFMAGDAGMHRVALQLDVEQSVDLDGPASAGFTVSCGAGLGDSLETAALPSDSVDVPVVRSDRL